MIGPCANGGGSGSLSNMECCHRCGGGGVEWVPTVPKALDAISDAVLAYRPKAKSKPARRRKRAAAKIAKEK